MAELPNDAHVPTSPTEAVRPAPRAAGTFIEKIFLNEDGLRAGWRLLVYLVFFVALRFSASMIGGRFLKAPSGPPSMAFLYLWEGLNFAAFFGAAVLMSRIEHRPVGAYGLPMRIAFGKLFWQGCLVGVIEVTSLIGLIKLFGGYSFGSWALRGREALEWAALWAVFFLLVGLAEEFLFRGYAQYTLAAGIGFWPAAIVLSLAFGAIHLGNGGEGAAGAAGVVIIGLIFALTLQRTGSLWFAVGLHASFDFGETFLYSVPDSGLKFDGHLSYAVLHGPVWMTGGSAGPEASIFSFLTMGVVAIVIHLWFPAEPAKARLGTTSMPPQ
ncbi:MAG: CPBP family intramembrane metalloprotease [Candidatus Acidiferrum sp.]